MKYMILSSLLKGKGTDMSGLLPLLMMGGKMDFMDDIMDENDGDPEEGED